MPVLKHRTMSAAVLEEVRGRILDGIYPAGAQLRQDVLAEELGVSRIPVREALFQLEAEGLIKIYPHKGATVAALSAVEAGEAFELRLLLEPRLLAASAPLFTETDYEDLDSILSDYATALSDGQTARWGVLNSSFHRKLYSRAGKPRTENFVANLLQECDRYTRLQLSAAPSELKRADCEHRRIVSLCRQRSLDDAVALLEAHIRHVAETLSSYLNGRSNRGCAEGKAKLP